MCLCFEWGWRKRHLAGSHWIDWYDGRDATEVMDAFHSEKERHMYKRSPRGHKKEKSALLEQFTHTMSLSWIAQWTRKRGMLVGARYMKTEYTIIGIRGGLVAAAALVTKLAPLVSQYLLVGLEYDRGWAGWLGHDSIHGVDPFTDKLRKTCYRCGGVTNTISIMRWPMKLGVTKILPPIPFYTSRCQIPTVIPPFDGCNIRYSVFPFRPCLPCDGLIPVRWRFRVCNRNVLVRKMACICLDCPLCGPVGLVSPYHLNSGHLDVRLG